MENISGIINLMNEYGRKKIPFLFIVDFEMNKPLIFRLDEIDSNKILFQINEIKNYNNDFAITEKLIFNKSPLPFDEYYCAFENVMLHIKEGNTYLCNLTFPTRIEMNYTLLDVFYASRAKYKLYYDDLFTVFSPESFIKINNGKIFSFPMKGTIDSSISGAEQIIIADKKELAEHTTIVDLIRNDLSIVSQNVIVENFRYVEKIITNQKNLLQVSSKISGTLPENYPSKIGNIIFNLLYQLK